ncbi:MAG: phosphoribosylformylglycinamidine cyclo-ligase [Candidatus Delongbacteria bacterium]|nr:phosphoribosylformylglycinamidine cyclo-ligase [Candidatus Delongbacteria bacterium]MCG2760481.1 AIR synthase-related protein [Candidatus Delongbacteria bacterium]
MNYDDKYLKRGASASKSEVHSAIKNTDKGIFPGAFCKIIEDRLGNDPEYCNIMHADGAGTKSSLAYIYYKETGSISVFKGIAQDSLIMNVDDVIAVGATSNILFSNTIGRNKHIIPGEIIAEIISGYNEVLKMLNDNGIEIHSCGGETADVGDLVKTIIIDSTLTARMKRSDVINNDNIIPGDVIIGLASYGRASYEKHYNSGMGSNGLTSARHDLFTKIYMEKYPESYADKTPTEYVYCGKYNLSDGFGHGGLSVGQAVLSPTRTYAPIIKKIFDTIGRKNIHGIVHNSGGGQVKCRSFGRGIHYIKDSIIEIPPLFELIKNSTRTDYPEMFQVFNMGCRMEIILPESFAHEIIDIAKSFRVEAKIVGRIEKNPHSNIKNKVTITDPNGKRIVY